MTTAHSITSPPQWAESLLRLFLSAADRASISGDLLEEYRESIVPALGAGANRWYLRQVAWYVLNATWLWAVLFGSASLARTASDWRVPTTDFALRSAVSTWTGVATLFAAAASAAWRSRSVPSGVAMLLERPKTTTAP